MTDAAEFIEEFLQHKYDPVKAREYYLRTRKLKGRRKGSAAPKAANPGSRQAYRGGPLKKLGSRMEEDETPVVSPSGAKLVDYSGKGLGRARYSDGMIYDAVGGWVTPKRATENRQKQNNAKRVNSAQNKINKARVLANKLPPSPKKTALLNRLNGIQKSLPKKPSTSVSSEKRVAQNMRRPVAKKKAPTRRNRGVV